MRRWRTLVGTAALALAALPAYSFAQQDPAPENQADRTAIEATIREYESTVDEGTTPRIRRRLPSTCGDECIINYLHAALIGTAAEADDMNAYKPRLTPDLWTGVRTITAEMITSPEYASEVLTITSEHYKTPLEILSSLYGAFLFRTPDASGMHTYLPQTRASQNDIAAVANALLTSQEFSNKKERILAREKPPTTTPLNLREKIKNDTLYENDFYGSIEHQGLTRTFFLHVPEKYFEQNNPSPLALLLHSAGGSGEGMTGYIPLSKPDADGTIMLHPNGTLSSENAKPNSLVWNAGHCCGMAVQKKIDDLGFLISLLGKIKSQFAIDSQRVYVAGFSNGGMMTHNIAAARPDLFAAAGITASTVGGCQGYECETLDQNILLPTTPALAVPFLMFHGFNDTTIPAPGGHSGGNSPWYVLQFSQELTALHPEWPQPTGPGANIASLDFWVGANGLDNAPRIEQIPYKDGFECTKITYDLPAGRPEVIGYGCQGVGHYQPVCNGAPQPCIDAPTEMWNFFKSHVRK